MASCRREFFRQLALLSASLAVGSGCRRDADTRAAGSAAGAISHPTVSHPTFAPGRRAVLEAACARILPTDAEPGAAEAGCAEFVDRQLGLPHFDALRKAMERGLDALDDMARRRFGKGFAEVSPKEQDELLAAFQRSARPVRGAHVFGLLLTLTLEGFLCDPRHGGNRDGVGWRFIGYADCFYHGRGIGLRKPA